MNVYQEHGYDSRKDYLIALSEDHGAPIGLVLTLAALLGPDEDFDMLIVYLTDRRDEVEEALS